MERHGPQVPRANGSGRFRGALGGRIVVVTLLAVPVATGCGCGPGAAGTAGGSSSESGGTTTDTSTTETGNTAGCGDGIPVAGELCFERIDLEVPAKHLAVGDLDGDNVPDIAVNDHAEGEGSSRMILWRPDEDPVVKNPVSSSANNETSLLVADFDGDGDSDLVVSVPFELRLHRGDGSGDLAAGEVDDSAIFWPSVAFDGDTDGTWEIVAGTGSGAHLKVYELAQDTWMGADEQYNMSACLAYSLLATDLDDDQVPDVVEVGWPGECPAFPDYDADQIPIAIFRGVGDGTLEFVGEFPTGVQPTQASSGDLDGDGIVDLVVVNQGSSDLSVLRGLGSATFAPQVRLDFNELGGGLRTAAVGDVDGDGVDDLLVVQEGLHAVFDPLGVAHRTALAETTRPVALADLNGDSVDDIVFLRPGDAVSVLLSNP